MGLRDHTDSIFRARVRVCKKLGAIRWRGRGFIKDPFTFTQYFSMIQDIEPKTIIEIGTSKGGHAQWLYDHCRYLGLKTRIITIDKKDVRHPEIKAHPGIEFHKLDVYNIEELDLGELEGPIMIMEDAHENLSGVVEWSKKITKEGDYLILEDTVAIGKYKEMNECNFLGYEISRKYLDMWGPNTGWMRDSIFKRI